MEDKIEIKDMLEVIYEGKSEELDRKISEINSTLKVGKSNEDMQIIEQAKTENAKLQEALENLEENYSNKMSVNIKELYKQGIIDGITLMLNVIKKK